MKTNKLLEMEFDSFYKHARKEQIEIAKKIMNKNEWIIEWCNAMGGSFFTEVLYPNTPDEQEEQIEWGDKRVKELSDFMDKWDNILKLSGDPIMITKNSFDELTETTDW